MEQCIAAVEGDHADSVILSCMPLQVLEDDVRRELNKAGFQDIPLICELSASVAMAKAVVGMKLSVARVAYPRPNNTIKPAIR